MLSFSRESYNALMQWLTDAKTLASPHIVVLLVGNKKDLENKRDVNFLEASNFAQENGKLLQGFWHLEVLSDNAVSNL